MVLFIGFSVLLTQCEAGPNILGEILPGAPNCLVRYLDSDYFTETARQFYFSIKQNGLGELALWSGDRHLPSMCETLD